ncbi:MAG TPA: hypothetical protein VKA84_07505, partial [Gemmatimonadaceae bacterium]|nr:hypothetical protein [Gemmatimonadaceae bacterium]
MAVQTPQGHAAAARAWAEFGPDRPAPAAVTRLQRKEKALVYRLAAAGPAGTDVIAKRSSRARILHERTLYERVLLAVGVPTVRYYGSLDEPDGEFGWLFL